MKNKLSPAEIKVIQNFYDQGYSVAEIAREVHKSYTTVWSYTKAPEYGYSSRHDYLRNHILQKYASWSSYIDERLRKRGFKSQQEYKEYLARRRRFKSRHAYQNYLARQLGFTSWHEYEKKLVARRDFKSYHAYREHKAQEKGFDYWHEYWLDLARKRQRRPQYLELSDLIGEGLNILEKSQAWLARRLGVCEGTVSKYIQGKNFPRKEILRKLQDILGIEYTLFEYKSK